MKTYILKIKDVEIYLQSMLMGGEPFFTPILALNKEKAGIFEEDKVEVYLKELNEQMKDCECEWEKIEV